MIKPATVRVRARDVKPYHYALWSSTGGEPFANAIVHVRWSDDGTFLWFGLDSHNFYTAGPDDFVDLIDLSGRPEWEHNRKRHEAWILPPPGEWPRNVRLHQATVEELQAELKRRSEAR